MKKEDLKHCLDELDPTFAQMDKMLFHVKNCEGEVHMKKKFNVRFVAAAAVIVCILAATVCLAANVFGWHDKMVEYLNPTDEQMQSLSGSTNVPNASISKDGVTIEMKQVLGDSINMYFLYEMTVPEGIVLSDDIVWEEDALYIEFGDGYMIVDAPQILEQEQNRRTVLIHASAANGFEPEGHVRFCFSNLGHYEHNEDYSYLEFVPVLKGEWELEWDYSIKDSAKIINVNRPVVLGEDKTANLEKIMVSSMSVCIYVNGAQDTLNMVKPVIEFKDGSQISYDVNSENSGYSWHSNSPEGGEEGTSIAYYRFENITDISQIESITVNGITVPIN